MNKRGTHIGLMLSFVIFLVFLLFLYTVFESRTQTQKDKGPILDDLKKAMITNLSGEMGVVTVYFSNPSSCIEINIPEISGNNIRIKDDLGNSVNYKREGNLRIDSARNFFKIYISPSFDSESDSNIGDCSGLTPYTLSSIATEKYVFEKEVVNMLEEDHGDLGRRLDLPVGNSFGFTFIFNNETFIGTPERDVSTEVYAEENQIQYVDDDANILLGKLNIKIW